MEGCSVVFGAGRSRLWRCAGGEEQSRGRAGDGATIGAYDVSFDVARGEIFVIIGLSGAGSPRSCGPSTA